MKLPLALAALMLASGYAPADDLQRARQLLARTPVVDGHNDVPIQVRERRGGKLYGFLFNRLPDDERAVWHTDIERLRQGGVGGQFWSVYVDANLARDEAVRVTLEQIDIARRLIDKHDALAFTPTVAQARAAMRRGRIASMLGAEGGHSIGNSLGVLRQLHALGVGYMTLTHSKTIDWADSATDAPRHGGLSPFGVEVVREMNRLGMLVDLSHVSPATMHDALDAAEAPVIFSHSNARAVLDHPRSVPDDVLKRLPENGGVIMITFIPVTLSADFGRWSAARAAEEARLRFVHPDDPKAVVAGLARWEAANPKPDATVAQVADHIDHVRNVAGIDHIGIGSDWDGLRELPAGLKTADQMPNLFAELIRRGYSDADLAKIAQGNILRVMAQAEQAAARLQRERGPSEAQLQATAPAK
jgi:membrane dipeptidase